jgi:hypothetical protein
VGVSRTGLGSLNARVDTRLLQLGVTSRPIAKLSLMANLRYQNRDDQTPIANYNLAGLTPYSNFNLSNDRVLGKLQANWQFNSDYRGTLAFERESIDRDVLTASSAIAGVSALRQDTDESVVRAELRRRLSENVSGSVTLSHSRRDGSNWLRDNSGLGVTAVSNAPILPSDSAVPCSCRHWRTASVTRSRFLPTGCPTRTPPFNSVPKAAKTNTRRQAFMVCTIPGCVSSALTWLTPCRFAGNSVRT